MKRKNKKDKEVKKGKDSVGYLRLKITAMGGEPVDILTPTELALYQHLSPTDRLK